jgi:hypothetical protein
MHKICLVRRAMPKRRKIEQHKPSIRPKTSDEIPVYKISSLKITPPKTPNSGQFSYPLPNIVSFLFRLEFRFRSRDFSFNLFPVWQPYCLLYINTLPKFGSVNGRSMNMYYYGTSKSSTIWLPNRK